ELPITLVEQETAVQVSNMRLILIYRLCQSQSNRERLL
ncbi:MAG: hypothetical protein ACI936_003465, partial [Paraglaciecola sp.]